jgi:hypothetical protein
MAMPRLPCVTHGDIARAILIAIVGVLLGAPVIVCVSACKIDPLSRGIGVQN